MSSTTGGNEASSSRSRGETVILDQGRGGNPCGYCKSTAPTSIVHGLLANSITVDDYQDLLDRGWRRSGSYLYKPEMEKTCCPSYTIRLKAEDFFPSKEQTRVRRRMESYLNGTFDSKISDDVKDKSTSPNISCSLVRKRGSNYAVNGKSTCEESSADNGRDSCSPDEYIKYLSRKIEDVVRAYIEKGEFPSSIQHLKATVKKVSPQAKKKMAVVSGALMYTSNISFQISAALRRLESADNDISRLAMSRNAQPLEFSIAEKVACILEQQAELSGISIKACYGHLNFLLSRYDNASSKGPDVDVSTQPSKRGATNPKCSGIIDQQASSVHKKREIEIHMKRSSFDPEEYSLYRKYQIRIHNDNPNKVSERSYKRFLVDTPLIYVPPSAESTIPSCGYGSFHQQYVIDGKLVAVGVVDILPRCLSSKYLFWDPDLASLSLGKYSALQEIEWVKENQVHCPKLQYYYLGYYIHSCSKMRYKASYRPSELLCPLRFQWVPFDIARPLLDKKPYVVLSDFLTVQNGEPTLSQIAVESTEKPSIQNEQHEYRGDDSLDYSDGEMERDFEGSDGGFDVDSFLEQSSCSESTDQLSGDVGNIMIDLPEIRLKFKDLQKMVIPSQMRVIDSLQRQLQIYMKAVGVDIADRMVYVFN